MLLCISYAQRLSSAAAGEERSDETDVGCSDLLGPCSLTLRFPSLDFHATEFA